MAVGLNCVCCFSVAFGDGGGFLKPGAGDDDYTKYNEGLFSKGKP